MGSFAESVFLKSEFPRFAWGPSAFLDPRPSSGPPGSDQYTTVFTATVRPRSPAASSSLASPKPCTGTPANNPRNQPSNFFAGHIGPNDPLLQRGRAGNTCVSKCH
jgi:hypothetical protein